MTDERADLLHRFGALAAVVALVLAMLLWRRRRAG
jgi:heme A synthase